MKSLMRKTEKRLKLKATIKLIEKGEIERRKLQIIYLILQNTSEHYIHNLNGVTDNKVYFHKDGHREAVYDRDGHLVEDGINDHSYNYYDRRKEPLKHFAFDTNPWIIWGASKRDTTSQQERIYGLVSDVEPGLLEALESRDNLENIKPDSWDKFGQLQTLAVFLNAMEESKSDALYSLFQKDISKITPNEITESLRALESGLNKVYLTKYNQDRNPEYTSAAFQKDADIVRIRHLKHYGELIEKYYAAKGKYPFQVKGDDPNYVYIAHDEQEKAVKGDSDFPHDVIPLKEFIAEMEAALGYEITEYYDPQERPDYKPNFYIYKVYQDSYYFAIHVHQPFSFAKKLGEFYYMVEISNYPSFRHRAYNPTSLFSSPEFEAEFQKKIKKEGFFKDREEKYIHFTKQ